MENLDKYIHFGEIVAKSKPMLEILETVKTVASSDATVLLLGETGTGKELIAHAIHNLGKRKDKPFITVNCAAIPETLLESELFGHEKGSFTGAFERHIGKFEQANGGTLFLDEVGILPPSMQAKLLRTLQEKKIERVGGEVEVPVNVRIISATNTDLKGSVGEGLFREDLYYRINVVPINVPALRDRAEDIPFLVNYFLNIYNQEFGKNIKGFTDDAMVHLLSYSWPGNIRELQNLIERLVALGKEDYIALEKLPKEIIEKEAGTGYFTKYKEGTLEEESSDELSLEGSEKELIIEAFKKAGGNKSKAAKLLGIHRNTLLKKIKDLRI